MDTVMIASLLIGGAVLLGLWLGYLKRRRARQWTQAARGDLLRERKTGTGNN